MYVPNALLRQLYTYGSLQTTDRGLKFAIKNRLSDAELTELLGIKVDGEPIEPCHITLRLNDSEQLSGDDVSEGSPISFPLRQTLEVYAMGPSLDGGKHEIEISFRSTPFGKLSFKVEDAISDEDEESAARIPRQENDDYSAEPIKARQDFIEQHSGKKLHHVAQYSFDAAEAKGNIEHFTGVAQIPLGFAGPLHVRGEHADGEYLIPLATSEGTLVASYNRGIKLLNSSGGVMSTVVRDSMQRAPVFVFENARHGRDFHRWVEEHIDQIREKAEATTSIGKLQYIDPFLSNRFVFLRFNYSTGDAAGQNMVGRATFAACSWVLEAFDQHEVQHFFLESNFATDKKSSKLNVMRTRGKRVTAEAIIPRETLIQQMRVDPETLDYHMGVSNVGAFMSGANNNGAHSPNAITAMFIATGQDVANVAESSAGVLYSEVTDDGDLYASLTIPSLIVATHGGGTGLPTQRECLEVMGCYGSGKVRKFAEIVAGVALAGELSLGAAISSNDWVSSHESFGRNR